MTILMEDPPLPTRTAPVMKMSAKETRNATLFAASLGVVFLIAALIVYKYSWFWVVLAVIGIALMFAAFGKKTLVTRCPFCGGKIGGILNNRTSQVVRCSECFEYSMVEADRTRACEPDSKSDKPRYWSPVFEGAVWPDACVECGASPTRHDAITDTNLNVLALGIGVAMLSRASLSNVPYCDAHKDAVQLSYSQTKRMDLRWKSLRMMRHYLAVNRSKPMLGSKVIANP